MMGVMRKLRRELQCCGWQRKRRRLARNAAFCKDVLVRKQMLRFAALGLKYLQDMLLRWDRRLLARRHTSYPRAATHLVPTPTKIMSSLDTTWLYMREDIKEICTMAKDPHTRLKNTRSLPIMEVSQALPALSEAPTSRPTNAGSTLTIMIIHKLRMNMRSGFTIFRRMLESMLEAQAVFQRLVILAGE